MHTHTHTHTHTMRTQVDANNNYSLFVMERPANDDEIREYTDSVRSGRGGVKKMTHLTAVRELFCCGSGKGGVMQNQGKENEYLPRQMPFLEGGNEKLDCVVAAAAGRHHVALLCYEDPLINVEAANKEQAEYHDEKANKVRQIDTLEQEVQAWEDDAEDEGEDPNAEKPNQFDLDRQQAIKDFLNSVDHMAADSQEKCGQILIEQDIDLETLSTLRDKHGGDETLREIGITAIGARRRLLKAIERMPRKWKPSFYAYQTADSLFISWPDSIATEKNRKAEAAQARLQDAQGADNPFMRLHRKKCGDRIFKALTRFAEQQHYEIIKERANLRFQGEAEGTYKCFTWGVGMHGRLGHGYSISYATPHQLTHVGRTQILRIALGAHHSIACKYDGSVLTWGNGQYGQLGNGQHQDDYKGVGVNIAFTPKPVGHLKRFFVISVAAGRWHNLALVNDRSVWAWGDNKFGQLGLDHFETRGIPQKIVSLDGRCTCSIHCGSWHSATISESGKMFIWGKNTFGQVGDGTVRTRNHPYLNPTLRSVGKVRTCGLGADHSVVVMVTNLVYSFGRGDKGQLGLPKIDDYHADLLKQEGKASFKIQVLPAEIVDLTNCNICQVTAGDTHTLALSVFGEVWSFGGSDFGQLGHGNIVDIRLPTPILPQRHNIPANIRHVCAGYTFSLAATDTGELYSWGQGEAGELGHSAKILMYAPTEVADLHDVRFIAAAHRHAAAITFSSSLVHLGADASASADTDASKSKASASRAGKSAAASSRAGTSRSGTSVASSDNNSQKGSTKGSRSHKGTRGGTLHSTVRAKHASYALVWGEDTCGQLGMRGLQAARSPTVMRALAVGDTSVTAVAASSDATAFVTNQGQLFMCGDGSHGKLGLGHLNVVRSPIQV